MPSEPKRKLAAITFTDMVTRLLAKDWGNRDQMQTTDTKRIINANKLVYGKTESGINQDH